jgi:hypothetical protein
MIMMNEIQLEELATEILRKRRRNKNETVILKAILFGNPTLPFVLTRISLEQFFKMKTYLKQVGIDTIFYMGTGKGNAIWELAPNALSDYAIKKRKENLDAIIYS